MRMGDWRVIFKPIRRDLIVVRVAHRSTVYQERTWLTESQPSRELSSCAVEYVLIPEAEYFRTRDRQPPAGTVDAHLFVRQSLADALRAAREHAKLTQAELAERLGKSQTMVATVRTSKRGSSVSTDNA